MPARDFAYTFGPLESYLAMNIIKHGEMFSSMNRTWHGSDPLSWLGQDDHFDMHIAILCVTNVHFDVNNHGCGRHADGTYVQTALSRRRTQIFFGNRSFLTPRTSLYQEK